MNKPAAAPKMHPDEFGFLTTLLKKHSGLVLGHDKEYLLESRLHPIIRRYELVDMAGLVAELKDPSSDALLTEVVEAMTTNESLFFRDNRPFEHLKKTLLPMVREKAKSRGVLRIWSAAASTGQESYSVAITLLENDKPGWRYDILATDLAQKVLNKAAKGIYTQFEVQRGLPTDLLLKYFHQMPDNIHWKIKDQLRNMVHFRQHNLLESFKDLGSFDIILCRNVLIYFNDATKEDIIRRMSEKLYPGGILMLGSSESLLGQNTTFKTLEGMPGIYQLKS